MKQKTKKPVIRKSRKTENKYEGWSLEEYKEYHSSFCDGYIQCCKDMYNILSYIDKFIVPNRTNKRGKNSNRRNAKPKTHGV